MLRICPSHDPRSHVATDAWVERTRPDGTMYLEQVVEALPLAEVKAERKAAVKAEAADRILLIAPEWKQRNLTARAAELALLYPGTRGLDLPEPERSEYVAGQAVWDAIKAVRTASDALEATIDAAETAADALAVDITAGWPG